TPYGRTPPARGPRAGAKLAGLPVLFRVELSRGLETPKQQERYCFEQAFDAARLVEVCLVLPERHFFLEQVVRIACEVEHFERRLTLPESTSQLAASHLRHHHVRNQDVQSVELRRYVQCFQPVASHRRLVARIPEHSLDKLSHGLLIVHDQDIATLGRRLLDFRCGGSVSPR